MDTVHGYHILEEQRFKLTHAKAHIDFINRSIDDIEAELFLRSRPYDAQIKQANPPKQKPVILNLDNTLQFLREQGADPETLKLIQQQCTAQAG